MLLSIQLQFDFVLRIAFNVVSTTNKLISWQEMTQKHFENNEIARELISKIIHEALSENRTTLCNTENFSIREELGEDDKGSPENDELLPEMTRAAKESLQTTPRSQSDDVLSIQSRGIVENEISRQFICATIYEALAEIGIETAVSTHIANIVTIDEEPAELFRNEISEEFRNVNVSHWKMK